MKIKIDGKEIKVNNPNSNIVEIADENGISITAPCFRNKKKNGCCKACLIEIAGKQQYACSTKPIDGMDIIYDRQDLSAIRKEKLQSYANAIKAGDISKNACDCSCGDNSSTCC